MLMDDNPDQFECQSCNGKCHAKAIGRTFSEDLSTCMKALLCNEVRVPELDLPQLDDNFRYKCGEVDQFSIYPEECCYGAHVGLRRNNDKVEEYQKCGWQATFADMPMQERKEIDPSTSEETIHHLRACPDEYNHTGKVTWMDFLKVCVYYCSALSCPCRREFHLQL